MVFKAIGWCKWTARVDKRQSFHRTTYLADNLNSFGIVERPGHVEMRGELIISTVGCHFL